MVLDSWARPLIHHVYMSMHGNYANIPNAGDHMSHKPLCTNVILTRRFAIGCMFPTHTKADFPT